LKFNKALSIQSAGLACLAVGFDLSGGHRLADMPDDFEAWEMVIQPTSDV
jgi:hypothetical protein